VRLGEIKTVIPAKRACVAPSECEVSVSGQVASPETEVERLKRQEREIRGRIGAFNASDKLGREDLHRREL
jgi:hypothetical protein